MWIVFLMNDPVSRRCMLMLLFIDLHTKLAKQQTVYQLEYGVGVFVKIYSSVVCSRGREVDALNMLRAMIGN